MKRKEESTREELKATKREVLGKKVRFLRRDGLTPANVYGARTQSIPLQIETPVLEQLLARAGRNALITLRIDGKRKLAMIRDIDRDSLSDALLHVGFFQVEMTHKVRAEVPIVLVGESSVSKSSRLMLLHNLSAINVEALPANLPRSIEVDISGLAEATDAVHVRDMSVGEGVEVLAEADEVVVQVVESRVAVEEVVAEEEVGEEMAEEAPEAEAEPEA
ncbi:MAG: 50S ribosomal protein L25 [Chloroflexota bacterium]|nr:50S ribosomal protein L25 [Chloroflexota bacterium]